MDGRGEEVGTGEDREVPNSPSPHLHGTIKAPSKHMARHREADALTFMFFMIDKRYKLYEGITNEPAHATF